MTVGALDAATAAIFMTASSSNSRVDVARMLLLLQTRACADCVL